MGYISFYRFVFSINNILLSTFLSSRDIDLINYFNNLIKKCPSLSDKMLHNLYINHLHALLRTLICTCHITGLCGGQEEVLNRILGQ